MNGFRFDSILLVVSVKNILKRRSNKDLLNNQLIINPDQALKWRKSRLSKKQKKLSKILFEEYYKIWIREEGIYKVSGADLKEAGIELSTIEPNRIKAVQ